MSTIRAFLATALLAFVTLPAGAQSLAEASAAAKKIVHQWPASTYIAPSPTGIAGEAIAVPAADRATQKPATKTKATGSTDATKESYWRDRLRS